MRLINVPEPVVFSELEKWQEPRILLLYTWITQKQYKIEINQKAIRKVFQRNSSIDLLCHNPFVYLFLYFTVETKGIFATKRI